MRKSVGGLVLLVALVFVGACPAQFGLFSANRTPQNSRQAVTTQPTSISPSSFLSSKFKLGSLFPSFGNPLTNNRYPIGRSAIPDTNSKEYYQAFGFHKLTK